MTLPLPHLDDRRWNDLVEEGRALIPRYAPHWTDHNYHDPGITLIELFAWFTEMNIYRLNQIPLQHRLKFLSLLGFTATPPRAARVVLTFRPDDDTTSFVLPAGVEFEATDSHGETIPFRTLYEVTVSVSPLVALQIDKGDGVLTDWTADLREHLPIPFFGHIPQSGAMMYLGFTMRPGARQMTLAFWFHGPGNGEEERQRIVSEAAEQRAACRPVLPDIHCPEEGGEAVPLPVPLEHHSARLVWEIYMGAGQWTLLEPETDQTRALTLDGIIEFNIPEGIAEIVLGEVDSALFYLRCRLAAGNYDTPPLLLDIAPNAVMAEQAVPVWQRFDIAPGVIPTGPPPVLGNPARLNMNFDTRNVIVSLSFEPPNPEKHVDVRVLEYEAPTNDMSGKITVEAVLVGFGNGLPGLPLSLPHAPVQIESFHFFSQDQNGGQEWIRRDDFDSSLRTDFHVAANATTGEVRVGDGERGRVVPKGTVIWSAYRTTQADLGNVPARAVTRLAKSPLNALLLDGLSPSVRAQLSRIAINRWPARGGAAEEHVPHVTGRAVETLHAHERLVELCREAGVSTVDQVDRRKVRPLRAPSRAVNLIDIERLALDVPGTHVARARAWAEVHPAYPCLRAAGVVTVVVLPDMPIPKPEPSTGLLNAVRRYLDRRRIVCTRIEVVGPQYLEVQVNARVRMRPGVDPHRLRTRIKEALNEFLDPRTGGPEKLGWPFGRDVYRSEILAVIDGVVGADHVLSLTLSSGKGAGQCGNLPLCPSWLVTPGTHAIAVE